MSEQRRLIFHCNGLRYEGYIYSMEGTHFIIKEVISNKVFWLPKNLTVCEEIPV